MYLGKLWDDGIRKAEFQNAINVFYPVYSLILKYKTQ